MSNYNISTEKIILGTTYDSVFTGFTENSLLTQKSYITYKSSLGTSALTNYLTTVSSSIVGETGSSVYMLYEQKLNTIKSIADKIQENFTDAVDLTNYLNSEITRSTNKEIGLSSGLFTESIRAKAGETSTFLYLGTENNRSISVANTLSSLLISETNRAQTAEVGTSSYINQEMKRALTAESSFSSGITSEYINLITGYTNENNQKVSGDSFNYTSVDNIKSFRIAGDSSFQNGLSSGLQQRNIGISSEYNTMTSSDSSLNNFLNTFRNNTNQTLVGVTYDGSANRYSFESDIHIVSSLYLSTTCRLTAFEFGTNFEFYNNNTKQWVSAVGFNKTQGNRYLQQGTKLVGSSSIVNQTNPFVYQGFATAISGNGKTIAIGGFGDNNGFGAVWIFVYSEGLGWTQQQKIIVSDNIYNKPNCGYSVSLSNDGNTVAFGGVGDDYFIGATWIWTRSGGVWTQQQKLVAPSSGTNSYIMVSSQKNVKQGTSVSLSSDGNTLAVGGPGDDNNIGAVWIWSRSLSTWTCTKKLVGTGSINTNGYIYQGESVCLSSDGLVLAVGAPYDCDGLGATWVFKNISGTWTQQTKLIGTGSIINISKPLVLQGTSVSVSSDGSTIVSGGRSDNNGVGALWVFYNSGSGQWLQQGNKLVASNSIGSCGLGTSVCVSGDGRQIVSGAVNDDSNAGASFYFLRNPTTKVWTQIDKVIGGGGEGTVAYQGTSVSMSSSGSVIVVGGRSDNNNIGTSWVFNLV